MTKKIFIYDTTLRDGAQGEGISFSVEDKLKISQQLDYLGVDFIEGGWPGSNPKDMEYFKRVQDLTFRYARIAAFSCTRKPQAAVEKDLNIRQVLEAETPVCSIFGKTWDFHVVKALNTTLEENLGMIFDTVNYLAKQGRKVFFDAEHFFDGYQENAAYALKALKAAVDGGASYLVLCDTNGGTLPEDIENIMREVQNNFQVPLGIHAHNDSGLAVANSLVGVKVGADQVQGTINGLGERCGNADLCSIIPNLQLKLGYQCLPADHIKYLTKTSRYVSELANVVRSAGQPFVGRSAFTHKGGIHVSAVLKDAHTYEHIPPEAVGNKRRILVSELSGTSNLEFKARELGLDLSADSQASRKLVAKVKDLEHQGFQFEGAEGSLELLLRKATGEFETLFTLETFKVLVEKRGSDAFVSEAVVKIKVKDQIVHTAAEGNGPVNALDNALRKALEEFYPSLKEMYLADYKVRVLDEQGGTSAKVRVLVESRDKTSSWGTVGVSANIIEASWQALLDSMEYALFKQNNNSPK